MLFYLNVAFTSISFPRFTKNNTVFLKNVFNETVKVKIVSPSFSPPCLSLLRANHLCKTVSLSVPALACLPEVSSTIFFKTTSTGFSLLIFNGAEKVYLPLQILWLATFMISPSYPIIILIIQDFSLFVYILKNVSGLSFPLWKGLYFICFKPQLASPFLSLFPTLPTLFPHPPFQPFECHIWTLIRNGRKGILWRRGCKEELQGEELRCRWG